MALMLSKRTPGIKIKSPGCSFAILKSRNYPNGNPTELAVFG
jgi:hypothetical protein